ncbi:MAG: fatty acid desaturase [Gammaproteobacteria bacterium]
MSRSTGLEQFHAQDRCDPLLWSLLPMGIWMAALSGSIAVDSVPAAVILSIIGGVAGSQLFVIGHDACHGSLTKSRLLNALIGRMAFVPSAHSFSLWAYFHNGLHHNFTNLRGHDFVWTPLSPDEFSRLSKARQFMECVYRHPTGAGIGLYYAIELWRRRLAWPTKAVPRNVAPSAYADVATTVTAWLLVGGATAFLFDLDVLRFLGGMALFAAVSLIIITWAIGFVVYFNHTHPRLKWYGCAAKWREEFSQDAGACHVTFSGIWWYLLPNVVMNHTLHHLDTRIPARFLAQAETHLESCTGTRLLSWRWTPVRHYAVMKRCGLYDYAEGRWVSLDWKNIGKGQEPSPSTVAGTTLR